MAEDKLGSVVAPHYPCEIVLHIHLTDGNRFGKVEYGLPHGLHPSERTIREALKEAVEQTRKTAPGDWRLCNRHEFVGQLLIEKTGQRMAIPGPREFKKLLTLSDIMGDTPAEFTWNNGFEPTDDAPGMKSALSPPSDPPPTGSITGD